jgi:hypothetical protein
MKVTILLKRQAKPPRVAEANPWSKRSVEHTSMASTQGALVILNTFVNQKPKCHQYNKCLLLIILQNMFKSITKCERFKKPFDTHS